MDVTYLFGLILIVPGNDDFKLVERLRQVLLALFCHPTVWVPLFNRMDVMVLLSNGVANTEKLPGI